MKKICILFLITTTTLLSQNNPFTYEKVFEIEMTKSDLKENINAWMVKSFKNTNNGITLNSDDNLIARGIFDGYIKNGLGAKENSNFSYLIEVSVKDNKYRLTLTDYTVKTINPSMQFMGDYCMLPNPESQEEFVRIHTNFYENSNFIGSNSFVKRLQKPEKAEKEKIRHKKYFDFVHSQIILNQESIEKSLTEYLSKKLKDKW